MHEQKEIRKIFLYFHEKHFLQSIPRTDSNVIGKRLAYAPAEVGGKGDGEGGVKVLNIA